MASNFLKYTGLTFQQIVEQVNTKLQSDSRFDNFRESAIAQILVEIFAGATDITNYNLERRAEECYFETAKLRSSVIGLSRSLGYDVQRSIPSSATIKIKLSGNLQTEVTTTDEIIQIPYQTVFSYEGQKYVLKKTLRIPAGDYIDDIVADGDDFDSGWITVDINGDDIEIAQGEIKEKVIVGDNNPQAGSKFQVYALDDVEFSNIYGSYDYDAPTTRVWVGDTKSNATEYSIDRRSLLNWESIEDIQAGETVNVCLLRTSITESAELLFGDARYAALGATVSAQGPITTFDNIYIQYLSTKGSKGNKTGVKDKKTNISGRVYTANTAQEVTSNVEFRFNSNLTGGADMETIDEIRVNAPNIYYSLDRLVSKRDYATYLKSLTSPINIKNAYAWGEQEESRKQNIEALKELFNIVFFTSVGTLYNTDTSPYSVREATTDLSKSVLDFNYDPNEISDNSYFNVYTKRQMVNQLREYDISATRWQLYSDETATKTERGYYGDAATTISVLYGSDTAEYSPSITGIQDITIDVSTLKTAAGSDIEFLNDLASSLASELSVLTDERGKSTTNTNINNDAFPGVTVTYNSVNNQFQIVNGENDPCKITGLSATLANTMGFEGKSGAYIVFNSTRSLAKNIKTVLDLLEERSQVTVNSIYVSPIIHNFDIKGTVFINPLFDIDSERTAINDDIYKFLDINADFNQNVYVSNIIELVENRPSVKYADLRFVPQTINGGPFYVTGNTPIVESYPWSTDDQKGLVYNLVDYYYGQFVTTSNTEDVSGSNEKNVSYGDINVQQYDYIWNKDLTTRLFFQEFAKNIYDALVATNDVGILGFVNSESFSGLLSTLWKDMIYIIRFNLLDTKGNIAQENDINGTKIKGGYSIGNEISKMNIQLGYSYFG